MGSEKSVSCIVRENTISSICILKRLLYNILYQESEHLDDKETYEVIDNKEQVITGVIETIEDWIKNYAKEEVKLICHERETYWHHELRTLSAFN